MIKETEFLLEGGSTGVLLIHGLTGTPNEMRILALGLNRAGFTVMGVQLAGHCGTTADLIETGWRDWYASVEAAADKLADHVDHLFVAGLSMGALLALKLAADRGDRIAGVGVLGAAFQYDGWSIPSYARYLNFLLVWFKRLGVFQDRCFDEHPPYGLKDERLRARVAATMQSGDSASAGLASNPWPSLAEMMLLSRQVRRQLSQVHSPCLVLHSSDDDIAHARNAKLVARRVKGPVHLQLLENSYHLITIDQDRMRVIAACVDFIRDQISAPLPEVSSAAEEKICVSRT